MGREDWSLAEQGEGLGPLSGFRGRTRVMIKGGQVRAEGLRTKAVGPARERVT